MVKLLDEFPNVHQNFNLVPSLITQIQDYVGGTAQDPFLNVAAKPAADLTSQERRFALQYLFQANPVNLIGRYPRYQELRERFREHGDAPERAEKYFQARDFTDLQVLSQISWFDEFFLQDNDVAALVKKGHDYSLEDQKFVIARERELLGKVLPAYAEAAVLSPDSSSGLRYECGGCIVARIAPAAESLPAPGRRARATGARTRSSPAGFRRAAQGRVAVGRQRLRGSAGHRP
jgi:alpha-amylase/alpha-mannosidase (GH57 family)